MSEISRQRARLRVRRGTAEEVLRFQTFEVEFEPGQSVLDALRWLRGNVDPSLAVRYACINANACKQCVMRIDGRNGYACTTALVAREMTIEPLPNKRLVRDLVTDTVPGEEDL